MFGNEDKYVISFTKTFENSANKVLSKEQVRQFKKKILQLKIKGDKIGKSLGPYYLRELKIQEKRVYYLVFCDINHILIVSSSDKKLQNIEINNIRKSIFKLKRSLLE